MFKQASFAACIVALALNATPPSVHAQSTSELIGQLSKTLGASPSQAMGAAGSIFGLAKSRLSAEDFSKVASAVPGMDSLLAAAPSVSPPTSGNALARANEETSAATGLSGLTSSFQKLGLKPEMVSAAVPVVTQYVTKAAGPTVGGLLSGVLK